ncbi:MAG: type II toxin-antitoxin system RelE/ParE family toxin [Bacteroidota bacterium]
MSYEVINIPPFDKQVKRLAKKYRSIKSDLDTLITSLEKDPKQGRDLGKGCYKVRMAISDKGKGKSGGARVITTVIVIEKTVYLLAIYDKSEKQTISDQEIQDLLEWIEESDK